MNLGDESLDLGDDVVFVTQSQPFEGSALPTDHAAWYTKG
jgi:hypothetical protein